MLLTGEQHIPSASFMARKYGHMNKIIHPVNDILRGYLRLTANPRQPFPEMHLLTLSLPRMR